MPSFSEGVRRRRSTTYGAPHQPTSAVEILLVDMAVAVRKMRADVGRDDSTMKRKGAMVNVRPSEASENILRRRKVCVKGPWYGTGWLSSRGSNVLACAPALVDWDNCRADDPLVFGAVKSRGAVNPQCIQRE